MVADFVLKFGVEEGCIQRQRVLLPVDAQLGVDALFRLQIVITDADFRIRISAVHAGEALVILAQIRLLIASRDTALQRPVLIDGPVAVELRRDVVTKIAVMIQTRRGGQGEVRHDHPGVFGKHCPAVARNFADRRDARRFLILNAELIIQLVARKVHPQGQLVIAQGKGVGAVGFVVLLGNKLR